MQLNDKVARTTIFTLAVIAIFILSTSCIQPIDAAKAQNDSDPMPQDNGIVATQDKTPPDPIFWSASKILIFSDNRLMLYDVALGQNTWEGKFEDSIYPCKTITYHNGNRLVTWINESGVPFIAILNPQNKLVYSAAGAIISARYENLIVVEAISISGTEGNNTYSTEIVDAETGKRIRKYDLLSPQYSSSSIREKDTSESNGNIYTRDRLLRLSGPASRDNIDVYGNTDKERIVLFDLEKRKELYSIAIEKAYGSPLELQTYTDNFSVYHYSIEQTNERLVCVNKKGNIPWEYNISGQLMKIPLFPYASGYTLPMVSASPNSNKLVFLLAHEFDLPTAVTLDFRTGRVIDDYSVDTSGRIITSIEFSNENVLLNLDYGETAVMLDSSTGKTYGIAPTETEPVRPNTTWEPFEWDDRATGIKVRVNKNGLSLLHAGSEKTVNFGFPGVLKPEIIGLFGKPPRYLMLQFDSSILWQDFVPTSQVMVVDFKMEKIIIGDVFDGDCPLYYGPAKLVVAGSTIFRVDDSGEFSKIATVSIETK